MANKMPMAKIRAAFALLWGCPGANPLRQGNACGSRVLRGRIVCNYLLKLCLVLALGLQGCAWGIYEDKRLLDTQMEDKKLATAIKADLLKANFSEGLDISVYAFYGHVFLVGEVPKNMQAEAMRIARSCHPLSITPHWFSPVRGERANLAIASDLRAALIGARGLSSTRIETEVNGGRVVLLGVVHDNREKELAIGIARKVKGVTSVTSYLMLPQRSAAPAD